MTFLTTDNATKKYTIYQSNFSSFLDSFHVSAKRNIFREIT
jgi:hypothetical protein